jgi:hypothetical protein
MFIIKWLNPEISIRRRKPLNKSFKTSTPTKVQEWVMNCTLLSFQGPLLKASECKVDLKYMLVLKQCGHNMSKLCPHRAILGEYAPRNICLHFLSKVWNAIFWLRDAKQARTKTQDSSKTGFARGDNNGFKYNCYVLRSVSWLWSTRNLELFDIFSFRVGWSFVPAKSRLFKSMVEEETTRHLAIIVRRG